MPVRAILQSWLLVLLLILVSVYDIRKRMIPDQLQIALACLAVLNDSWITLFGIFGALPYLGVAYMSDDGIGGGDIKLAAATGIILGLPASILASLIGLFLFLMFGLSCRVMRKRKERLALPLGPFLAVGTITAYFIK